MNDLFYVDLKDQKDGVTGTCQLCIINFPNPVLVNDEYRNKIKFIVDCGLFQGEKSDQNNNNFFDFEPSEIDFALLTHAHADHYGRFPQLVRKGYYNAVFMTRTTARLLNEVALDDCAKLTKKAAKRSHKEPMYKDSDIADFKKLIVPIAYNQEIVFNDNIKFYFFQNGHLPGAAMILVQISYPGCEDINLFFTGDYNNKNRFFPVSPIPSWVRNLKTTLISESTYGTTNTYDLPEPCFVNNILDAIVYEKKTVLLPTFSLGRTQEVLYILKELQDSGKLSRTIPIYLDGLTAQLYTNLFASGCFKMYSNMENFLPENLRYVEQSQRMNITKDISTKIIVSSSGMMSYGPAKTYAQNLINNPNVVIHLTGYASEESTAGKLKAAELDERVEFNGLSMQKRARVMDTTEFSAHAKADELIDLYESFSNLNSIIIHHGDSEVKEAFAGRLLNELDIPTVANLSSNFLFRITSDGVIKSISTEIL